MSDPRPLDPVDDADRWPRQLAVLTDCCLATLTKTLPDLDPARARQVAFALIERITSHYGGSTWYIPKSDAIDRARRNLALWAEYDGTVDGPRGIRALARRHHLTEVAVWGILREQRQLHLARHQLSLPL